VTLLIAHHVTKAAAKNVGTLLTLEDLTQAGFDAWARQWWLVSRREKFVHGSGLHELLVAVGNCSSHSMDLAVDINEGTKEAPKWEVTVRSAGEVGAESRSEKRAASLEDDIAQVRAVLTHHGALAQSAIKDKAGINSSRWKTVTLPALLERGVIKQVPGKRNTCPHYVLAN
jgi:hypothetical protein